jgi:hypothetical protein
VEEAILDAAERMEKRGMHLPLDQLEKLSNCLLGGKIDEADAIIRDTLQRNAEHHVGLRRISSIT